MAGEKQASIPFTPDAVHPGEIVSEYAAFHGWTQRDLARRTGLTPKTISEICNGKAPLTPTTALALGFLPETL
jgi:plasmid maintenance system antidote protein VapI